MNRNIALIIICCILVPMLTSCFDAREVTNMAYVMSVGFDRGLENKYRVSFQIVNMKGGGGESPGSSSSGVSKEYEVITVDAPSFFGAVNLVNTSVSRKLNFMHTQYMVFSEEAARAGHLAIMVTSLIRFREVRRTAKIIISKGNAQDFLKEAGPVIGSSLPKYLNSLVEESRETGFFPYIRLIDIYCSLKSPYRQPIAIMGAVNNFKNFKKEGDKWDKNPEPKPYIAGEIPRTGGSKVELTGCVLGDKYRVVQTLDSFETRLLLIARGEIKRFIYTSADPADPQYAVIIEIKQARKPSVKVSFDGENPIINARIQLEGDILVIHSGINYEEPQMRKKLEEDVVKVLKPQLDGVIKKCQKEGIDVFDFAYSAAKHFKTIQEWEAYNWAEHFSEAQVNTEMDFTIRRTGTMIKSSPLLGTEDDE